MRSIELPPIMTVEELSTLLAMPPASIISGLIKNGIFATMNQMIDYDTASASPPISGSRRPSRPRPALRTPKTRSPRS